MGVDESVCECVCVYAHNLSHTNTLKHTQTRLQSHSHEPYVYASVFEYLCKELSVWVCVCVV